MVDAPSTGLCRAYALCSSIYFREPGGILSEMAIDSPRFAFDEERAYLGERLMLPAWQEGQRAAIERALPRLTLPQRAGVTSS